jgi:protease-4
MWAADRASPVVTKEAAVMAVTGRTYRRIMLWSVALFVFGLWLLSIARRHEEGRSFGVGLRPGVGLIELRGAILTGERTVREIEELGARSDVRALLVRIESPGGAVVGSDEIYRALARVREQEGKPVVAWLGSVAASGGYYVACAADTIVAHPASTTGSIGVIVEYPITRGLFEKLGIEWETVATGPYKTMGSPTETPSEAHRAWFRAVIGDTYEQFLEVVRTRRGIPEETLRSYADGRVFTGRQAVAWGFADTTGDFRDARAMAGRMGGVGDDPRLIRPPRPPRTSVWDLVMGRAGIEDLMEMIAQRAGIGPVDAPHVYYRMP